MGGLANAIRKEKNIDIVMCIDATSSMGPCIENVRKNATLFYKAFAEKMEKEYNSDVTSLRVQIVAFRDLECDEDAIVKSEFFELPQDSVLFERYLAGIRPRGGGDYKESGLEALYTAMTTDWEAKGDGDRQVIVLFTDADAIGFNEKRNRTGYPDLCDENAILNTWYARLGNKNTMRERCKRLVMFAPGASLYKDLVAKLNRSQHTPVAPMKGMADVSFDDILKLLCASASAI